MKVVLVVDVPENVINLSKARANVEIIDNDYQEHIDFVVRRTGVHLNPLPERMNADTYYRQTNFICDWKERAEGWNDCLDELLLGDAE